jgi:hypothetical protein
MTGYPGDEEIVEGEIVDEVPDGQPAAQGPEPLPGQDTILVPCHHGCTCGLHAQVTYGSRVPQHDADVLDHGEMGLLAEAAEQAERRGDAYHAYLARRRELTQQARNRAKKLLTELELLLADRDARRAERTELAEQRAALPPDKREPAPRWLKATAIAAAVALVAFDAYFFQQAFLDILQITRRDVWWKQEVGLLAALIFAVGVITVGRMVSGPVWRISCRWRRPAGPDDKPPGRLRLTVRALVTVAPAVAILYVLGLWALVRARAAAGGDIDPAPVMVLLLSLALTVIVLEVLVYNPYQAAVTRDKREVRRLLKADREASDALTAADLAWRDLRSGQDEVISLIHAEMLRPWHTVILPARLRHGRAGPDPVPPEYGVEVRVVPVSPVRKGNVGIDLVQITYRIFKGVEQPQPSPGPLAETVRSVMELHPEDLLARHRDLQERLRALTEASAPTEAVS